MKMKKLFASLLATSIVAAGVSAFAAPVANDAGFDKEAGTYSIAADLSAYGTDQMTILIIPEAAYLAGTVNDADILYIDQAAANTQNIFKSVGILGGTELTDGTYYAKIGGENIAADGIIVEKFTVTTTPEGPIWTYGDVTGDGGKPNMTDALQVLYKSVNRTSVFDDKAIWRLQAGDITEPYTNEPSMTDALQILYYSVNRSSVLYELRGENVN